VRDVDFISKRGIDYLLLPKGIVLFAVDITYREGFFAGFVGYTVQTGGTLGNPNLDERGGGTRLEWLFWIQCFVP